MTTLALVSCSKLKQPRAAIAEALYSPSDLFRKSYRFARQNADVVYILSAKYGIVPTWKTLEPYDETLATMAADARRRWAERITPALRAAVAAHSIDRIIWLAGSKYIRPEFLEIDVEHSQPLAGLQIGERLRFLKDAGA